MEFENILKKALQSQPQKTYKPKRFCAVLQAV